MEGLDGLLRNGLTMPSFAHIIAWKLARSHFLSVMRLECADEHLLGWLMSAGVVCGRNRSRGAWWNRAPGEWFAR